MNALELQANLQPGSTSDVTVGEEGGEVNAQGMTLLKGAVALTPLMLAACGGGSGSEPDQPVPEPKAGVEALPQGLMRDQQSGLIMAVDLPGKSADEPAQVRGMTSRDAVRLLTQATFGVHSPDEISALQREGLEHWLWRQFNAPCTLHSSYLDQQRYRDGKAPDMSPATEYLSYEAIWRQWLFEDGQLRGRVAFALSQIMVISNIAPNIKPYAMSSYMDMLNRNAFGNFRTLLKDVTLHPAMGYYLNMLKSIKEDPKKGTHPNENYAREILQLFSIGLVKLNIDGTSQLDALGKPIPAYTEDVVKGFARAFSGWGFGGEGNTDATMFNKAKFNNDANWVMPMLPFAAYHESGSKQLLDNVVLPAGQSVEKDMNDAIDNIFNHPNVGPFISRQLIQRLVTSNPSAAYIRRVAEVFNNNGAGVRGDLRAVVHTILTHAEARGDDAPNRVNYGKQREPVIRLLNMLRAFNATTPSPSGQTDLHKFDSPSDSLGQSPLLAPSVFNFFSPNYRQSGVVAPEFQITTETSVVGTFNTFANLFMSEGYGWGKQSRLSLNFTAWEALALKPEELVDRMDLMLCNAQMSLVTRNRLLALIKALPSKSWQLRDRIKKAFIVLAASPDFVIQK
jgi:uncharacterized protein (DUF1800 family)